MAYIDSHVHVWTNNFERYPLDSQTAPEDMDPKTFFPSDIKEYARRHGVDRIVLIQMSYYGTDNSFLLDTIESAPETFSGVAIVDHRRSDLDSEIQSLRSRGVRGFRIVITDKPSAIQLSEGEYEDLFRYASEERMAVCPLINPEYLPLLRSACTKMPGTRVVVDHLARIGMSGRIEEDQVKELCLLAESPNVFVKVSAFYALGRKKPPYTDLAPLIEQVRDAYTPQRLMWGSDAPFQVKEGTYADSIDLVRSRLEFLNDEAKDWILEKTAESVFFSD